MAQTAQRFVPEFDEEKAVVMASKSEEAKDHREYKRDTLSRLITINHLWGRRTDEQTDGAEKNRWFPRFCGIT